MHKSVSIEAVVANPFRHMDRYPIKEGKIDAIMASMERTGFWDNVVARKRGDEYELAYGHHRWIAFQRKFGDKAIMNLIVRDLSDADMLRIMADENMQEFGTSAEVEQETVRAVVMAYAEGKVELERPDKNGHVRYAPSFRKGKFNDDKLTHPYTAESVARFLGWTVGKDRQVSPRVRNALSALEAIEEELVTEEDIRGLSSDQAEEIAVGAKRIKDSYENAASAIKNPKQAEKVKQAGREKAKLAAKTVAEKVRKESVKPKGERYGVRDIQSDMEKARTPIPKDKELPSVERFGRALAGNLSGVLGVKDVRWTKINKLIQVRDDVDPDTINEIVVSLRNLSDRCLSLCDSLEGKPKRLKA